MPHCHRLCAQTKKTANPGVPKGAEPSLRQLLSVPLKNRLAALTRTTRPDASKKSLFYARRRHAFRLPHRTFRVTDNSRLTQRQLKSGAYFPFRGMYVQRNILSEEGVICAALSPSLRANKKNSKPGGSKGGGAFIKATVICSAQKSPCCAHAHHAPRRKQKIFILRTKTARVSLAAPNISRNRQQPPYTAAA